MHEISNWPEKCNNFYVLIEQYFNLDLKLKKKIDKQKRICIIQ